jgi:hypothetical protein
MALAKDSAKEAAIICCVPLFNYLRKSEKIYLVPS